MLLDWTSVIVAAIGLVGVVVAAYWQFVYKPNKEALLTVKQTSKDTTEQISNTVNAIAANSLTLLERLLKEEQNKVSELEATVRKLITENNASSIENARLVLEIERHKSNIKMLEGELERLRGRMDALLKIKQSNLDSTNGDS